MRMLTKKTALALLLVGYSVFALVTLILFIDDPTWRWRGVAWNSLFQVFAPLVSWFIIVRCLIYAFKKKLHPAWAVGLVLLQVGYLVLHLLRGFPIILSV